MAGHPVSMIDFHTHILPGIDDGSRSVEQSMELLQMEASQGITDVVLTSHFYASQGNVQSYLERRGKAFEKLAGQLVPELPKLHLGAEVQYFEGISVADDVEKLCIQGTDLLLLEMPFFQWSDRMIQDVLALNERKDIQILLAHVDRYMGSQPADLWEYLSKRHILMQANTFCFKGFLNRRKFTKLFEQGIIHVLGTDCHSTNARSPDWSFVPEKVKQIVTQSSLLDERALLLHK